jgi:dTDP-4-amino-4,6-dideoxygalactose transaminase
MISQCGTDKLDFIEKKVPFYSWKTVGSNYLLAEPLCAILLAGLRSLSKINKTRNVLYENYYKGLQFLVKGKIRTISPMKKGGNGHIFYLCLKDKKTRDKFIAYLKKQKIEATFHYSPLHLSEYYLKNGGGKQKLKNAEFFGDTLVRLPMFYQLSKTQQKFVIQQVKSFFDNK